MKKKTKQRIFAALATVALALPVGLGLGSKAQAADESSNPTQTIEIHKLIFDKIPEKQTNNGSDNPFQDGKPLNGAGFTAYDVTDKYWDLYKTNKGNSEQAVKDLLDKIKEPNKSDQAKDASGKNIPEVKTATKDGAEGVADLVLPTTKAGQNAVYIIFETTTPNGANNQKAIPFVVGLPVYTDTENLLSPIKVYPKNEYRTSTLEFTKYGVYLNKITKLSSSKPLSGAMFYLEDTDNKKIYSTETNDFTLDETDKAMDKAKLSSDDSGKVSVPNLVLKDGGHYAFYEMDSSVSTSSLQEQTEKEEIFHYSNNPVVIVDANRETNTEKNSQAKMILTYHFNLHSRIV
ncbi:pilin N-terminal domain-containing protein [Enterococcus viikkiensis]|uniref:pilin N-terminal domain-containing protein n=1 Tax=Enterococcus viikkiensis TaxID=930854 RepID=UPI0010F4ADBE|nr:pilin N-terminal domain-containing protein [Enterococcus viikkiensis]